MRDDDEWVCRCKRYQCRIAKAFVWRPRVAKYFSTVVAGSVYSKDSHGVGRSAESWRLFSQSPSPAKANQRARWTELGIVLRSLTDSLDLTLASLLALPFAHGKIDLPRRAVGDKHAASCAQIPGAQDRERPAHTVDWLRDRVCASLFRSVPDDAQVPERL